MHFRAGDFSIVDTAFVSWNCIFDVDVSVRSAAAFEHHQSIVDDVAQASDTIKVDAVQCVDVAVAEQI
jgi:hypothetical protein